jgi:hypothetical protein
MTEPAQNVVAPFEPAHRSVATMHGGPVHAIVPQTFDEIWRFAQAIAKSGLTPYGMKMPEQVMVAILTGLELGIKPMQAVQGIAVINGRPSVWGDLALAIVRATGQLEYIKETYEGSPPANWSSPTNGEKQYKAVCRVKRRGEPEEVLSEFSIDDAMVAKLWMKRGGERGDKDTPWVTNPKRMLKMRARGFALRDTFTDALKGVMLAEEMIGSEDAEFRVVNEPPPAPPPAPPAIDNGPGYPKVPERDINEDVVEYTEIAGEQSSAPATDASAGDPPDSHPAEASTTDDEIPDWDARTQEIVDSYATAKGLTDVQEIHDLYADDYPRLNRRQQQTVDHARETAMERLAALAKAAETVKAAAAPPVATEPPPPPPAPKDQPRAEAPPATVQSPVKAIPEVPTTPEEYEAWWVDFLANATRSIDIRTRWGNQTEMRDKLNPPPTPEQRVKWRRMGDARSAELKAIADAG